MQKEARFGPVAVVLYGLELLLVCVEVHVADNCSRHLLSMLVGMVYSMLSLTVVVGTGLSDFYFH